MSIKTAKGFIVLGKGGDPMELVPYENSGVFGKEYGVPKQGILMFGTSASVFETRRAALAAARRTEKFATRHKFTWGEDLTILPLKAAA